MGIMMIQYVCMYLFLTMSINSGGKIWRFDLMVLAIWQKKVKTLKKRKKFFSFFKKNIVLLHTKYQNKQNTHTGLSFQNREYEKYTVTLLMCNSHGKLRGIRTIIHYYKYYYHNYLSYYKVINYIVYLYYYIYYLYLLEIPMYLKKRAGTNV